MKRRLFTILSALSLLLCVAVCALWVRSYFRSDSYYIVGDDGTAVRAESARGFVSVVRSWVSPSFMSKGTKWSSTENPSHPVWGRRPSTLAQRLGFWCITAQCWHGEVRWWVVPYWFLSVLMSVLPPGWLIGHRCQGQRRHRIATGLCPACGYDLRATPGRCLECGRLA